MPQAPFQRVIDLAPQGANGHAGLTGVYALLSTDVEEAVQLARAAVKLEPTATYCLVLAAACERLEDWPGAESASEHAIELDPANPRHREALATLQKVRRP